MSEAKYTEQLLNLESATQMFNEHNLNCVQPLLKHFFLKGMQFVVMESAPHIYPECSCSLIGTKVFSSHGSASNIKQIETQIYFAVLTKPSEMLVKTDLSRVGV